MIDEAAVGDPAAAQERLELLADLPLLDRQHPDVKIPADELTANHLLPETALADARQVAVSAAFGVDYRLTWQPALRGRPAWFVTPAGRPMRKANLNFLVDTAAFVGFVFLTATGGLVRYVLPPGSGHFSTLWGMDRHEWGQLHFWIAVALLVILAIHLCLHWRWVVSVIKGRPREGSGTRLGLAIVAVVALTGLAVAPFFARVEQGGEPPHRIRLTEPGETPLNQINGSMTLGGVEQATGVQAAVILRELGLPPEVPAEATLGMLRKQYDFDMHDVRDVLRKHAEAP